MKLVGHEIPIVMAETGDPIGTGLVASLPRPGGNVTGLASVTAELAGKCVQLIRDMLPSARRVTLWRTRPIPSSNLSSNRSHEPAHGQLRQGCEDSIEVAFCARIQHVKLEPELARRYLQVARYGLGKRTGGRINE
jgi:ABC transporter substrate binding protein